MFKKCLTFIFVVIAYHTLFAPADAFEECVQRTKIKRKVVSIELPAGEYPYNPNVPIEEWGKLKPYFLPEKHPVKSSLDALFKSKRIVSTRENLIEAGFNVNAPKHHENLIVGSHPSLKKYLIKTYVDTQDMCDWENFYRRITGAQSIQACIKKHGYQKQFKVPKKWLYPLPLEHSPHASDCYPKSFILVVENMHILDHHRNSGYFKNKVTPGMLDALYTIITEEGLLDSVYRGNIPFNKAGQINFIDTEHHHHHPSLIPYQNLIRYLSPEMGNYWRSITPPQPVSGSTLTVY